MNRSIRAAILATVTLAFISAIATSAQKARKPYTQWSEKQALQILNESPWGHTQVFTTTTADSVVPDREGDPHRAIDHSGSRMLYISQVNFRIRFLTAKPVRQAISRLFEMNRLGGLSPQFTEKLKAFIEEESPDSIVVSVYCDAPRESVRLNLARELLQLLTTDDLKNSTYLAANGGRRVYLEEYQQPAPDGVGARFIFPRLLEGKPLLGPGDNSIRFHAELSFGYILDSSFKTKDMVYEGRLEY